MTRYTVVWHDQALDELAELWLAATDRAAISRANDQIDAILLHDASIQGSPVDDELRQLTSPPLRVLFSVRDADRLVTVLRVRLLN